MTTPQELVIRRAGHADLPSIVRMLADDPLGRIRERYHEPLPRFYEDAFHEISRSDANELLVASTEDRVVGVLQITLGSNRPTKD